MQIFKNFDTVSLMKNYLKLLQKSTVLKRLSLIQLISYFGAWFSNVAIYTLLINLEVGAEIIAFVAMLHFLSGTIQAPFSGAIIDKFAPKKLMLFLIFVQIVSTAILIVVDSKELLWLLYSMVFIKMAAASFYFTTEMSLLPRILKGKELQFANEIHSIIWSFSYTLGMAISGYFVYLFGIKVAFLLDAALFTLAFFMLLQTKIDVVPKRSQKLLVMIHETLLYLKSDIKVLHLMLVHAFVGFTAFDALVALMADYYYKEFIAASLAIGLLHSFRAFGLVVGPMILGKWMNKKRVIYLFVFEAIAIALWAAIMQNFYLSLAASIVVGFFTTTLWSYSYTLIQQNMDEAFYGRVVAYNDMLFLGVAALTSYLIGYFAKQSFSLQSIAFMMALTFLFGAMYYTFILKRYSIKDIE